MTKKTFVQLGAGNIGRSFLGQVFSRGGYEVVFADINPSLVAALNRERKYRVIVKKSGSPDRTIMVENVRAVPVQDKPALVAEIAQASVLGMAVGKDAIASLIPDVAAGLIRRRALFGDWSLDIIIAENVRHAAGQIRAALQSSLPADYPLDALVGLVQSSIGKMVPIMKQQDLAVDPLWVFAEEYNQLILDRRGFKNAVPSLPEIKAVENIRAYVDRKLFIHNLGHSAAAYFTFQHDRHLLYLCDGLAESAIRTRTRQCMDEAARALNKEYPDDLPLPELHDHIADLLARFENAALGDTVYRVGRDLQRKLARDDRFLGAILLAKKHRLPCPTIIAAVRAALSFGGADETGKMLASDRELTERLAVAGMEEICRTVFQLSPDNPIDKELIMELCGDENEPTITRSVACQSRI